MSSSPFIKRAKNRSNVRQKDSSLDDSAQSKSVGIESDGGQVDQEDSSPSPMLLAKNRKKQKPKKSSTGTNKQVNLSFANDEEQVSLERLFLPHKPGPLRRNVVVTQDSETTAFVPKKSKLSQSMSMLKSATTASALSNTSTGPSDNDQRPSTPSLSYSSAYLDELKAATPTRAPKDSQVVASDSMVIDTEDTIQPWASSSNHPVLDTTQGIPDEAHIAAAKAKRKGAVGQPSSSSADYISLDPSHGQISVYDPDQPGPHPESRLQRSDDEAGSGDDDFADFTESNTHMALGKQANKMAARKLKHDIVDAIDEREMEDVDDEDEMAWEMAQAARADPTAGIAQRQDSKQRQARKPALVPAARPLPTVSAITTRLETAHLALEDAQTFESKQIDAAQAELAACDAQESDLRQEVTMVESKREWVEEFRGWVEMLGGFLEEKASLARPCAPGTVSVFAVTHPLLFFRAHRCPSWPKLKPT